MRKKGSEENTRSRERNTKHGLGRRLQKWEKIQLRIQYNRAFGTWWAERITIKINRKQFVDREGAKKKE